MRATSKIFETQVNDSSHSSALNPESERYQNSPSNRLAGKVHCCSVTSGVGRNQEQYMKSLFTAQTASLTGERTRGQKFDLKIEPIIENVETSAHAIDIARGSGSNVSAISR